MASSSGSSTTGEAVRSGARLPAALCVAEASEAVLPGQRSQLPRQEGFEVEAIDGF